MKLSDVHIREKLASGQIRISPEPADDAMGSLSVDLRLGTHFRVFRHTQFAFIDLLAAVPSPAMNDELMESIKIPDDGAFYLHPGELALGITRERITLPAEIAGWLDGRSSLARLGLMVHLTAHTIDPGWDGQITLEFANIGPLPLALRPGMRICAISFELLTGPTSRPYRQKIGAKYAEQDSPLCSRITQDRWIGRDGTAEG